MLKKIFWIYFVLWLLWVGYGIIYYGYMSVTNQQAVFQSGPLEEVLVAVANVPVIFYVWLNRKTKQ